MMKQWSRICFLVLAISNISRGENGTFSPKNDTEDKPTLVHNTNETEGLQPKPSSPISQMNTSVDNTTNQDSTVAEDKNFNSNDTAEEVSNSTDNLTLTTSASTARSTRRTDEVTTVPMATTEIPTVITRDSSWAYVILVLIILVIIALCIILYFLRRVSRSYSFDLQRPSPSCPLNEPTGTFEPVYLDDLDRPVPNDEVTTDISPPPVANGTTPSEEMGCSEETAPQEQPDENGVETPVSNTSPATGDDSADKPPSPANSTSLFFDALGEEQQQNENNNNPSVCSSDPFVEINLDDPALCDQLLTSPEATSSVLPFSPFSFSSSS